MRDGAGVWSYGATAEDLKMIAKVKTGSDQRIGQNPQFSRRSGTFRRVLPASERDPTGRRYECAPGPYERDIVDETMTESIKYAIPTQPI